MPNVIETAQRYKNELLRHESSAVNQAINAYGLVVNRLEDKLTVLQSRIEALDALGQLTPEAVRKQAVWSSLLNQVEDELDRYGKFIDTQNRIAAKESIDLAEKHSEKLTAVNFNDNPTLQKAFTASWDRLPKESVETLLGFLQPDSELTRNLTKTLGKQGTENFAAKLIEGIALGYNPKKINQLINQTLGEPLTWSLNTVRTTQLYTYREASRANYVNNSEIVGSWKWYAALDGRVCLSCVSQHGKDFPVNTSLNDHHSGRCVQIPLIDKPERFGLKSPEVESGEKWFNKLPKTEQVNRMGIDRHKAYKQGKFNFGDLSEPYQNDTFGEMLKERSLKSLLALDKPLNKPVKSKTQIQTNKTTQQIFSVDSSLSDKNKAAVKEALQYIDNVHKFPVKAGNVPIEALKNASREGVQGHYDVKAKTIRLKDKAFAPIETTIHEIGHYIDFALIGNKASATELNEKLDQWRDAVANSKAYKTLVDMSFNPDKYVIDYGFAGKAKPDPVYTSYMMNLEEVFARSYAQYILTKNSKDSLLDEIRADVLYGSRQWDSKDFKPILKAFDKLFEDLKWN